MNKDGIYFCINNGFDANLKLDYNKSYNLIFGYKTIDISDENNKFLGWWEIQKWQDFNDYFISIADWRDKQIDSILEE